VRKLSLMRFGGYWLCHSGNLFLLPARTQLGIRDSGGYEHKTNLPALDKVESTLGNEKFFELGKRGCR
jgi:hypothetical protein